MPDVSLRRRILIAVLLGAAGFVVNLLRLEIFFNVDFIFGSVLVMLAVLRLGPVYGTVAACIAGSATLVLWNHPWALVIVVAEAICVGWLVRKRSWDLLKADILYWVVLGAPLVWVFYHHVLQIQAQTAFLVILKQAINGITTSLLACLLYLARQAWSRQADEARPAFRPIVFVTLVSLVTLPALLFLAIYLRQTIRQEEQLLVRSTSELGQVSRDTLHSWIRSHHLVIGSLAKLGARPDLGPGDHQHAAELVREGIPAFMRVGFLDAKAEVVAFSPLYDEEGRSSLGRNFSDRPYIPTLKATLKPHVGDLVMARIGPPTPMLPLVAPIVRDGQYAGYCIGVTDTGHIQELVRVLVGQGSARLTILDRNGRVVCSTRPDLTVMSVFAPPAGEARTLGQDVWHWVPKPRPGSSLMQRWRQSLLVREDTFGAELPWKVRVETPLAPLIDNLTRTSIIGLGILFVLVLATTALAQAISRAITLPVRQLEEATRAVPSLLQTGAGTALVLPSSGIDEMHHLSGHFGQMAGALRTSFRELRALKDTLEQRVATRTQELQTALDTIKTLHGLIPICASCKKIRDDKGSWNQLETYISEHTDAAFTHGICPECAKRFFPEMPPRSEGP